MKGHTDPMAILDFLERFTVDFNELCGGLRLAARHLPCSFPSCQDERDAINLLSMMLLELKKLEQALDEHLSLFLKGA